VSDHCDGHYFFNPDYTAPKNFKDLIKWHWTRQRKPWPKWIENQAQPEPAAFTAENDLLITFINHVTFLIQTAGMNILTDPVFSHRVSPFRHVGPCRVRAPGLSFDQLPSIDLVLVSHNHYDHMDLPSIKLLAKKFQPLFITPLGNGHFLKRAGAERIVEMDWWQSHDIHSSKIITVPAQHWSARGLHDRNRALWAGFVIETSRNKIYFAGDTGYANHFKQISECLGVMDVALLPIGAYEPRWFMRDQHMNPDDAVLAHMDLNARLSIGMHYGVFRLTDEGFDEPLADLQQALKKYRAERFVTLLVGETRRVSG
jgi:L-ascorbate metabolism protein UlaG (beta-lactamase superfamily)